MREDRWRTVENLFCQALDIPDANRSSWLEAACQGDEELRGEVASLLASDEQSRGNFVEGKVERAALSFHQTERRSKQIRQIGAYRIVRELGRGGMGTVYLAERADEAYRKQVAIKLIRPGMDTDFILARFRRERQILARLEHLNIARLLDGGATPDGLPYLVMEYVEGGWISSYCQSKRLSVEQRLALFLPVCSAVTCAHQNFIVHRDLKPGNILIDPKGVPKLLDFGISKLLYLDPADTAQSFTRDIRMVTPDYASPEQVLGEAVTVTSDVYSLGAVLYELLTGVRPHHIEKLTPQAVEQAICRQDVVLPSVAVKRPGGDRRTSPRRLTGDLDNILMRALQKDPHRRYESVEQFAEDIRRHLAHLPVHARPDTLGYRAFKFARRNRGLVLAASAVLLILAAGLAVSLREARIARRHFEDIRALANTFVFEVHDAVRDLPGATRARQLIVQTGLQYLDRLAQSSSGNRSLERELAAAYQRIGELQGTQLGDPSGALASYAKALAFLEPSNSEPADRRLHLDQIMLHRLIGEIHANTKGSRQALDSYREALRKGKAALSVFPGDEQIRVAVAELHLKASDQQRYTSDHASAQQSASEALSLFQELATARPRDEKLQGSLGSAHSILGMTLAALGQLDAALDHYWTSVTHAETLVQANPANAAYRRQLMLAYSHVGDVLGSPSHPNLGDKVGALKAYRQMVSAAQALFEADSADQQAMGDYAIALMRQANITPVESRSERLALFQQALDLMARVESANPNNLFNRINRTFVEEQIGDVLTAGGNTEAGRRMRRQSLATAQAVLALDARQTSPLRTLISVCRKLGEHAARQGRREEALNAGQTALRQAELVAAEKPAGSVARRVVIPKTSAAMGSVYALLAASQPRGSSQRLQDLAESRRWNEQSRGAWRLLAGEAGFTAQFRTEMEKVEAALAGQTAATSQVRSGEARKP